jgi:hypothetical protein
MALSLPPKQASPISSSYKKISKHNNKNNERKAKKRKGKPIRQQTHLIHLPNPQSHGQQVTKHKHNLDLQHLSFRALRLQSPKRVLDAHDSSEWILEQHEYHHDAEDLERVAGHVHADGVHGQLFSRRDGEFPGFFQLELVEVGRGGRFAGWCCGVGGGGFGGFFFLCTYLAHRLFRKDCKNIVIP